MNPRYTLNDYRNAPSGVGPLADEWEDKPHRLLYDLLSALDRIDAMHRPRMTYDGGWWPGCTQCGPTLICHVREILHPDAPCPCTEVQFHGTCAVCSIIHEEY